MTGTQQPSAGRPGSGVPAARAPFGRMLTAMITPMTADGALDAGGAARLATYLVDDMPRNRVDAAISPIMKLVNRTGSEYLPTALL